MKNKIILTCLLHSITIVSSQKETKLSYAQVTVINVLKEEQKEVEKNHQYNLITNYINHIENLSNKEYHKSKNWRSTEYSWCAYPQSQGYIDSHEASSKFFDIIHEIYQTNFMPKLNNY